MTENVRTFSKKDAAQSTFHVPVPPMAVLTCIACVSFCLVVPRSFTSFLKSLTLARHRAERCSSGPSENGEHATRDAQHMRPFGGAV